MLLTALSKWAKQARNADPGEILTPVIQSFLASDANGLHADAVKNLFRLDGDALVPFRPKARAATTSTGNNTDQDDEEES